MKKNLSVEAAILDLRHLSEETLASYEQIGMQAALVLTGPDTETLLAKHAVELEAALVHRCDDETAVNVVNGKATLCAARKPEGKTILIVNGKLNIDADAADTMRAYEKIVVNGKVLCPESLVGLVTEKCSVNGKLSAYPDDAVVLNGTVKLDRLFLLRAQERLYWTDRQFVAAAPDLDAAALAAKGARFSAPRVLLAERFVETLLPLFNEDAEVTVLPEGTVLVDDDLELTSRSIRRYGARIHVLGDVTVSAEAADALEQLEYLHSSGDVLLPAALEDAFYSIPDVVYKGLRVMKGKLIHGSAEAKINAGVLASAADGISCMDCNIVTLDKMLTPEEIMARLQLNSCAVVCCTAAQEAAVTAVSTDVACIRVTDAPETEKNAETVRRTGTQLTL